MKCETYEIFPFARPPRVAKLGLPWATPWILHLRMLTPGGVHSTLGTFLECFVMLKYL